MVMVTRSIAFAKSNNMPATSFPIRDVMSEHCRLVAAQDWQDIPYWLYGVFSALPGAAGGLISASTPDVAGSGWGTPGWHRLLRSPVRPEDPSERSEEHTSELQSP